MEEILDDHRLLDLVGMITSKGESGRLQIRVGATQGAFFFKNGKLVDARLGNLAGFSAVNAAVSIRQGRFSFDRSIQPPSSSFNTLNERVVLKQLFGIEASDPSADYEQVAVPGGTKAPVEAQPTANEIRGHTKQAPRNVEEKEERSIAAREKLVQPISLAVRQESEANETLKDSEKKDLVNRCLDEGATLSATPDTEVTVIRGDAPSSKLQRTISYPHMPSSSYHRGLYVAILLLVVGVGAHALLWELNDRPSLTSAAKPSETPLHLPSQVSKQIEQASSSAHNLTGQWKVVNIIEKTSYRAFSNMEIGFRLMINQTGKDFTAIGEKVSENGRVLPSTGRTPIHVIGSIDGDMIHATFLEQGAVRRTKGRFDWRIANAGAGLAGTFISTAARTSGTSAATKEL
jgi:hypothetical protein